MSALEVDPGLPSAFFSCLRSLFRGVSGQFFCAFKGLLGVFQVSFVVPVRVSVFA